MEGWGPQPASLQEELAAARQRLHTASAAMQAVTACHTTLRSCTLERQGLKAEADAVAKDMRTLVSCRRFRVKRVQHHHSALPAPR